MPGRRQVTPWDAPTLLTVLWWLAVALAVRSLFEPVMVAFYLWPVLAVALITAASRWSRLIAVAVLAITLTFGSQATWHSWWAWWAPMVIGLTVILLIARPVHQRPDLGPSRRWNDRGQVGTALRT